MKLKSNYVLPLIAVAVVAYYLYIRKRKATPGTTVIPGTTEMTKQLSAEYIVSSGNSAKLSTVLTFEEAFVKAWAKAAMAGLKSFDYNGKKYNTKGGKVVRAAVVSKPNQNMNYPIMNR